MMKNFFGLPLDKLLSDTNSEAIAKAIFPFIIMLIAGIFFIILYSIQFFFQSISLGFSILGIVGTTAGAAILSGSFLGFLFGIPRIDRKQDESESDTSKISNNPQLSKSSISVIPNTNLEEISDWLTKILVGVGLTQINPIFNSINSFAKSLSPALTNPQIPELKLVSEAFTLLILIYFCICGFFLAFLWARLYLPESFRNADSVKKIDKKVQQIEEDIEKNKKIWMHKYWLIDS